MKNIFEEEALGKGVDRELFEEFIGKLVEYSFEGGVYLGVVGRVGLNHVKILKVQRKGDCSRYESVVYNIDCIDSITQYSLTGVYDEYPSFGFDS